MDETTAIDHTATESDTESDSESAATGTSLLDDELLVEEISIDGMCGVY